MSSDKIISLVVLILSVFLHFVVPFISSVLTGKKITKICNKCFSPVVDGEQHTCLTTEQLDLVEKLILSFKGDNDGSK